MSNAAINGFDKKKYRERNNVVKSKASYSIANGDSSFSSLPSLSFKSLEIGKYIEYNFICMKLQLSTVVSVDVLLLF